jgi:hypothetical protein
MKKLPALNRTGFWARMMRKNKVRLKRGVLIYQQQLQEA